MALSALQLLSYTLHSSWLSTVDALVLYHAVVEPLARLLMESLLGGCYLIYGFV